MLIIVLLYLGCPRIWLAGFFPIWYRRNIFLQMAATTVVENVIENTQTMVIFIAES